jgi:hypothetical protein
MLPEGLSSGKVCRMRRLPHQLLVVHMNELSGLGLDVETIRRVMGVVSSGPGPLEVSQRARLALL